MSKRLLFLLLSIPLISQGQFNNFGYGLVINSQLTGSSLQLWVNDPALGIITSQMSNVTTYIIEDGCVISTNGSSVAYATYDTEDHQWISGSTSTSSSVTIHNKDGVVGWTTSGGSVYYGTYDPIDKFWSFYGGTTGSNPTLILNQGIAAFSTPGGSIGYGIYDYSQHQWTTYGSSTGSNPTITVAEGIVAYSTPGGSVYYAAYDHVAKQWSVNGGSTGINPTLINQDGIIAYSTPGGSVHYATFDPLQHQWVSSGGSTGINPVLSITDGTVQYTVSSSNYSYGYDPISSGWQSNILTNIYCVSYIEIPDLNHTDYCVFRVESIGANAYSYTCGDGQNILQRNAIKRYNNAGIYNPFVFVSNSSLTSNCSNTINIGTGISGLNKINFEISPNPTSSSIKIKSPKKITSAQLANIQGKTIASIYPNEASEFEMSMNQFPSGMYFIQLNIEGNIYNEKIIKQ
jgi:hypothetical protein